MLNKIKLFISRYKHAFALIYFLFYMPWFTFLNGWTPTRNPTVIYCGLDDLIPFCELFVIPYFLWFGYIALGYVFLLLTSRKEFLRMCIFLYTGMTISLIIYSVFPNCQQLRINYEELGRQNILIDMISALQSYDTPCNVLPSIHTLNSIGMHIAIAKSNNIVKHRNIIVWSSFILAVLIVLSTVFVKQHSILDVFAALILSVPLYFLAYKPKLNFIKEIN